MQDMVGIRAGILVDDPLLDEAPKVEVYVEKRPAWRGKIEGALQLNGKYEVVEGAMEELAGGGKGSE